MKTGNIKTFNRHVLLEQLANTAMAIIAMLPLPGITHFLARSYNQAYDTIQKQDWLTNNMKPVKKTHPIYEHIKAIRQKTGLKENIIAFEDTSRDICVVEKRKNCYYIIISRPYTDNFTHEDWKGIVAQTLSHILKDYPSREKKDITFTHISEDLQSWAKKLERMGDKILSHIPSITAALPYFAPEVAFTAFSAWFLSMRYSSTLSDTLSTLSNKQRDMAADEIALQLVDKPETYRNAIMTLDGMLEVENEALMIIEYEGQLKNFDAYVKQRKQMCEKKGFHTFLKRLPNDHTLLFTFKKATDPDDKTFDTRLENIDRTISRQFGEATLAHCHAVQPCEEDILMKCYKLRGPNTIISPQNIPPKPDSL